MTRKRGDHSRGRATRILQRAIRRCRWRWRYARRLREAARGQIPGVIRVTVLRARGLALSPGSEAYVKVSILGDVGLEDDLYAGPPVLVAARTKWVDGGGRDPDWAARHGNALALPWAGSGAIETQRDEMDATPFEVWVEVWGCRAAVGGSGDDAFVGATMVPLAAAVGRAPMGTPAASGGGAREWIEVYDTDGESAGMVQLSLGFVWDVKERGPSARRGGGGGFASRIISAARVAKRRGLTLKPTPPMRAAASAIQSARRRCIARRSEHRDVQLDRALQQGDVGEILLAILAVRGLPQRESHTLSVQVSALGLTARTGAKEQSPITRWSASSELVVLPWSTRVHNPVRGKRRASSSSGPATTQWEFRSKDEGGADPAAVGGGVDAAAAAAEHDGGAAADVANARARALGGRDIEISVWSRAEGGDECLVGRTTIWVDHSGSVPMLVFDEAAEAAKKKAMRLAEEEEEARARAAGKKRGKRTFSSKLNANPPRKRATTTRGKGGSSKAAMPRFRKMGAWDKRSALLVRNAEGRVCCEIDLAVAVARSAWRLDFLRPKKRAVKRSLGGSAKAPSLGVQKKPQPEEAAANAAAAAVARRAPRSFSRRALQREHAIRTSMSAMRWQPGTLRLFIQRVDGLWFDSPSNQLCAQIHARLVCGRGLHADAEEGWASTALVRITGANSGGGGGDGWAELSFEVDTALLIPHNATAVRRLRSTREPCVLQLEITQEDERSTSSERIVVGRCNMVIGAHSMGAMAWHALDGRSAADSSIAGRLKQEPPLQQLISALTCASGRILLAAEFIGTNPTGGATTTSLNELEAQPTKKTDDFAAGGGAGEEGGAGAPTDAAPTVDASSRRFEIPSTGSLLIYALVARPLLLPGDFRQHAVSPARRIGAAAPIRPQRLVLHASLFPGPSRFFEKKKAQGRTLPSILSSNDFGGNGEEAWASDGGDDRVDPEHYEWDSLTRAPIRLRWGEETHGSSVLASPARSLWTPSKATSVKLELLNSDSGDIAAFVEIPLETLSNGAPSTMGPRSEESAMSLSPPFQQRWIQFDPVTGGLPMQVLLSSALLVGEESFHHLHSGDDGGSGQSSSSASASSSSSSSPRAAALGAVPEAGLLDVRVHALRGVSSLRVTKAHAGSKKKMKRVVPEDILVQLTMWPHSSSAPALYMTDVAAPARTSHGGGWRRWDEQACLPVVDRHASVLRAVIISKSTSDVDRGVAQVDIPVGKISTNTIFRFWFPLHLLLGNGGDEGATDRAQTLAAGEERAEVELSLRFISLGDIRAWSRMVVHTSSPGIDHVLGRAQCDYLALRMISPRIQGVLRVMVPRNASITISLSPMLKEQRGSALPLHVQVPSSSSGSSPRFRQGNNDLASVCELLEIAVLENWIARTIAAGSVPKLIVTQLQGSAKYTVAFSIMSMMRQPTCVFERVLEMSVVKGSRGRPSIQLPLAVQFIASSTSGNDRSVSLAPGVRQCTDRRSFNLLASGVRQPRQEAQVSIFCVRARDLPHVVRAQDPIVVARLLVSRKTEHTMPASRTAAEDVGTNSTAGRREKQIARNPVWGETTSLSLTAIDIDSEILELTVMDSATSAIIGVAEIALSNFVKTANGTDCARAWLPLWRKGEGAAASSTHTRRDSTTISTPWMRGELLVDFSLRPKYASSWTPAPSLEAELTGHIRASSASHGLLRVAVTTSSAASSLHVESHDVSAADVYAVRLALTSGTWTHSSSNFGLYDGKMCVADVIAPLSAGQMSATGGGSAATSSYSGSLRITLVCSVGAGSGPNTPNSRGGGHKNQSVSVVDEREIDIAPFALMSGQPALLRVELGGFNVDLRLQHFQSEFHQMNPPISTAAVMTPGQLHITVEGAQGIPAFLSNTSVELTLHMHGQLDLCFEGAASQLGKEKEDVSKDDSTSTVRGWGLETLLDYAVAPSIDAHECGYADDIDVGRSRAENAEVQSMLTPLLEIRVLCADEGNDEAGAKGTESSASPFASYNSDGARELGRAVLPLFSCITRMGHLVKIELPLTRPPVPLIQAQAQAQGGAGSGAETGGSRLSSRVRNAAQASSPHRGNVSRSRSREKSSDAVKLALQFVPKDSAAWLGDLVATEGVAAKHRREALSMRTKKTRRHNSPENGSQLVRNKKYDATKQLQESSFDSTLNVCIQSIKGVGLKSFVPGSLAASSFASTQSRVNVCLWIVHPGAVGEAIVEICAQSSLTKRATFHAGFRGGGSATWNEVLEFKMPPLWQTTEQGLVLCKFELRATLQLFDSASSNASAEDVALCEIQLPLRVVQPTGRTDSGLLDTWVSLRAPDDGAATGRIHLCMSRQMVDEESSDTARPFSLPPVPSSGSKERRSQDASIDDDAENSGTPRFVVSITDFDFAVPVAAKNRYLRDPIVVQIKGETTNALTRHAFVEPEEPESSPDRERRLALDEPEVWRHVEWLGSTGEIVLPLPTELQNDGEVGDEFAEVGALTWTLRIFRIGCADPSAHARCGDDDVTTLENLRVQQRADATVQPQLLATAVLDVETAIAKRRGAEIHNKWIHCSLRGHGPHALVRGKIKVVCRRVVFPNNNNEFNVEVTDVAASLSSTLTSPWSELSLHFRFLPGGTECATRRLSHADGHPTPTTHGGVVREGGGEFGRLQSQQRSYSWGKGTVGTVQCRCASEQPLGAQSAKRCVISVVSSRPGAPYMLQRTIATCEVSLLPEMLGAEHESSTPRVVTLPLRGTEKEADNACGSVTFTLEAQRAADDPLRASPQSPQARELAGMAVGGRQHQHHAKAPPPTLDDATAPGSNMSWLSNLKALFYQASAQNALSGGTHFTAKASDLRARLVSLSPDAGAGASESPAKATEGGGASPQSAARGGGGGSKAIGWAQWVASIMPKLSVRIAPDAWHTGGS